MLGFGKAKLPVSMEQKEWVDRSFVRLAGLLGANRLIESEVVLPTEEYFPDPYDRSEGLCGAFSDELHCGWRLSLTRSS
jgi:hypothetical protein